MKPVAQLKMTKEVPLYFYKGQLAECINGDWTEGKEIIFKSVKVPVAIIEADVARAFGLKLKNGVMDYNKYCLTWWQLDVSRYFRDLPEV
jgi:hypothetical protein